MANSACVASPGLRTSYEEPSNKDRGHRESGAVNEVENAACQICKQGLAALRLDGSAKCLSDPLRSGLAVGK